VDNLASVVDGPSSRTPVANSAFDWAVGDSTIVTSSSS
jgi:hypothetical protein